MRPRVSIVLPTFNRLKYLRAAVDSVLAQTFTDWELIVADDGSEAETATYLQGLVSPPRIRALQLIHSGNPGFVRNAAWRSARGEYIAFIDSDDVWLPEKLTMQIASLERQPARGWSHTAFAAIDEAGQLLTGRRARRWPAAQGWILESLIRMETVIAIPSVIVRRALLEQVGGFDVRQRMCEDYELWLRLAGVSEIDGIDAILLHVRDHRERFHKEPIVLEDRSRALTKLLLAGADRSLQPALRKERAKAAAALARNQAILGRRWAALRTLARSSRYSWGFREWWSGGSTAAARAMAPASVVRIARALVRRGAR